MRRTASEILNDLEMRVAHLEDLNVRVASSSRKFVELSHDRTFLVTKLPSDDTRKLKGMGFDDFIQFNWKEIEVGGQTLYYINLGDLYDFYTSDAHSAERSIWDRWSSNIGTIDCTNHDFIQDCVDKIRASFGIPYFPY